MTLVSKDPVTADTVTGEIISSWDMHGNPTCGDPPPSIRLCSHIPTHAEQYVWLMPNYESMPAIEATHK